VIVTVAGTEGPQHRSFLMSVTSILPVQSTTSLPVPSRPGADLDVYIATRLQLMAEMPAGSPMRSRLRDEVICACLPVVRKLAARFHGRGESVDDLVQVATIGLIKSVDRFDVSRETQFLAYATPTVVGEIKRHFRDKGWSVKVSRPMQELSLEINRVLPDLTQQLGRTPLIADIAEHLGVGSEDVIRGLDCGQAYSARSLSAPVGGVDSGMSLSDLMGGEDPAVESVADRATLQALLAGVPERERQILALRFFGNLTQNEIAERIGVSQMHVSRLLTRTLKELRERLLADPE
jgi:RNA polymerase sigma-B factor